MPYNTIIVDSSVLTTSNDVLMTAVPSNTIEQRNFPRRFYNFNLILANPFATAQLNGRLVLTDNASVNVYSLIDRLNKPVTAKEVQRYATFRRPIACQFDSVTGAIRVLSPLCLANRYANEWADPASSKDPIETVAISATTVTTPNTTE